MGKKELFDKIIKAIETTYPKLKGSQFIGESDGDDSIGMMVNSDNGIFFIDVNYTIKNDDVEIIKIIDRVKGIEFS